MVLRQVLGCFCGRPLMSQANAVINRISPVAISSDEFRVAGHRLVDRVAEFLDSLPESPITQGESPSAIREAMDAARPLPREGAPTTDLLDRAATLLFDHSLFNGHPSFWGYVTSSPAPIGMLGDFLASAVNANCGAWLLSPMASEIEAQTVRWIAEMLGYPTACGGLFVSGGNMANMVCFLAARAAKAGSDIRSMGVGGARLRAYCSSETHTWIQKGADISGLGTDSIRWIPADEEFRMDIEVLRTRILEDIETGDKPFLVIANAGTVSTRAVDPLSRIASLCREFDLWLHVDGAYGALAAIAPEFAALFAGLGEADSIAVDPHKWLYAPLEAGCALVRDVSSLRGAFAYHPPYYHFGVEAINYFDLGPQNSRGFRALKVWLALQQVGCEGYVHMLTDDIRLARELFDEALQHPALQAFTLSLSIATFRYLPPDLRDCAEKV